MKTLFILGLLSDSILNIISSGVQSYYVFLLVKFVSGILWVSHKNLRIFIQNIDMRLNFPNDLCNLKDYNIGNKIPI